MWVLCVAMEVVVQLFFYARRFAVGAFQDRREFLRRPEILVVASFQYFPFFAVFLAHNRRNISARRSLRQAYRIFADLPYFALALSSASLSACPIFFYPPPPLSPPGLPCGLLLLIRLLVFVPSITGPTVNNLLPLEPVNERGLSLCLRS